MAKTDLKFIVVRRVQDVWQSNERLVWITQIYLCPKMKKTDYLHGFSFVLCGIYYVCKCCWTPAIRSEEVTHSPRPQLFLALCPRREKKRAVPINFAFKWQVRSRGTAAWWKQWQLFWTHFFSLRWTAGNPVEPSYKGPIEHSCRGSTILSVLVFFLSFFLVFTVIKILYT